MSELIEYMKEFTRFIGLLILMAGAFGLMVVIVEGLK